MDLEQFQRAFHYPYWLNEPEVFSTQRNDYTPSVSDFDTICSELQSAIARRKWRQVTNWLATGFVLYEPAFLDYCRRHGILRLSRYGLKDSGVVPPINALLDHSRTLNLSSQTLVYPASVSALHRSGHHIARARKRIVSRLSAEREDAVLGCLRLVERVFMQRELNHRARTRATISPCNTRGCD